MTKFQEYMDRFHPHDERWVARWICPVCGALAEWHLYSTMTGRPAVPTHWHGDAVYQFVPDEAGQRVLDAEARWATERHASQERAQEALKDWPL